MNAVLLTGAGFSDNWGGRLAREINTAVKFQLKDDYELTDLLQRNPNFEEALTELQNERATSSPAALERLQKFETAIINVFGQMNKHLADTEFNFTPDRQFAISEFLILFDAIFTLNQDLLLEKHYLYQPGLFSLAEGRKWLGCDLPGMEVIPDLTHTGLFDPLMMRFRPKPSFYGSTLDQYQPYVKLHGSTNWQDPDGGRLLVMGGNKETTMWRHSILKWYADKFAEYLSRPGARLMVIGYGFRDEHINRIIHQAWLKGGKTLTMFIVHPDGREVLKKVNSTFDKPIYVRGPLEDINTFDSTRQLRTTFGGNDRGEHELLLRYARGG